jgi:putative nucleotidyltransferase with HDIG domain
VLPGGEPAGDLGGLHQLRELDHGGAPVWVRTDGAMNSITLLGDAQVFRRIRGGFEGVTARVAVYIAFLHVIAWIVAAALVVSGYGLKSTVAVVALAAVAMYGERGHVTLRKDVNVSISLLPAIFAAVLFGPLAAMAVFGASAVFISFPLAGRVCHIATRALTGALSAGAVAAVAAHVPSGTGRTVAEAAVAALVAEVADTAFAALTFTLRGNGSWRSVAVDSVPVIVASVPFYSSAVAILALSYQHLSPWTLPLFFGPALAAQRFFLLYQEERRLSEDLQTAIEKLRAANLSFARGLVATLDARDRYTAGHSAAVAVYAADIARRMSLEPEQVELAYLCGLVHDIGKIGLPAGLLEKPGALTLEERREMQRHSEIGEGILANVDTYAEIAAVVRHHHERVDGQGYPDGIAGMDIPLLSRIIAVADAYNAMTSDRPYRDAMPSRVARLRLAQAVETQFDTSVVAAFEAILASARENYRVARGPEFAVADDLRSETPEAQVAVL